MGALFGGIWLAGLKQPRQMGQQPVAGDRDDRAVIGEP
jgi:hypothetical protein